MRGEFDLKKNLALVNDIDDVLMFQNFEPKDKPKEWEDDFDNFCDLLVEEMQGCVEESDEGDTRIFCGALEVIREMELEE